MSAQQIIGGCIAVNFETLKCLSKAVLPKLYAVRKAPTTKTKQKFHYFDE